MALILGTTRSDVIFGLLEDDTIFGDPFTEGNFNGFPGNGAILSSGRGGNDRIDGGDGTDYVIGDAAVITGTGRGGNDHLIGGPGGELIPGVHSLEVLGGDADTLMSGLARGGNDFLDGGTGENYLVGDTFDMIDSAQGGNDHLIGGPALDWMIGDADGLMDGNARGGNDLLEGGGGDDELRGDNGYSGMTGNARGGNDRLDGGSGDDLLIGDGAIMSESAVCGNDVIIGGLGDDRLYGDADPLQSDLTDVTRGSDRFVFANGSGLDTIFDFEDGRDMIDLTGFQGIAGFDQVSAQSTRYAGDVVIDLGAAAGGGPGPDVLTLAGFALFTLDAADFAFG